MIHYPKRSLRAVRMMAIARQKIRCDICGDMIGCNNIERHRAVCDGPMPDRRREDHNACACGRLKRRDAIRCFACAPRDPIFAELDRQIANGDHR